MDPEDDERLRAVERALAESDRTLDSLPEAAALADDVDALEDRLATLEGRVDELDAALQAVRGYVGNVRHVNREVERTAEAALAKAQSLDEQEDLLDGITADSDAPEEASTGSSDEGVMDRLRGVL